MQKFNLIIIHTPDRQQLSDFVAIKARMARRAPDIEVHIISQGAAVPGDFWRKASMRPTALFSPMPVGLDPAIRGARLIANRLSKFKEVEMLAGAGFPVPRTQKIKPGIVFDEAVWGPFVVVKPNRSFRGRGIRLARTSDVRWIDTAALPEDDPRHGQNLLAQQYIYTGPHSTCYRVMTVLAKPVYSMTSTAIEALPPLQALAGQPVDLAVAANGVARRLELSDDREVIALAADIHAKLTHTPVMGVDIIREFGTGRLFALELNSGGWTWHLSSEHGRGHQRDHQLDYYGQFNALKVIADALTEATRRLAV